MTLLRLLSVLMMMAVSAGAADRPDILFILADDLGYADPGFNGGKEIPTPNLDKLAASGAVLECFYAQAVCTPTRAALLTGRYPMRYGLQQGVIRPTDRFGLALEERTLAQALREAGYTTAIAGKWHLGEFEPAYRPTRRGFDLQYGNFLGALDYTSHIRGHRRDWQRNDEPCADEGYTTTLLAAEAVRIVKAQPADKPLFLYVPFNAVHSPYHIAPGREKDFPDLPPLRRRYATMLSEMDAATGRILTALEESGRRRNTLIFFSSDNGGVGPADNGKLRGRKGTAYEGGQRVAACVSWPGRIKPGSRITEPLHMVDWFPTLASPAGYSIAPEKQKRPLDGRDALQVLTTGAASPHDCILLNTSSAVSALRMGDWKLVLNHLPRRQNRGTAEQVELFNLKDDPYEQKNLSETEPGKLAELTKKLREFQDEAVPPLIRPGQGAQEE